MEMFTPEAMNTLVKYVEDFNDFSKLVQLNYEDLEAVPINDEEKRQYIRENLQWNKACRSCIQGFLENLSRLIGVGIKFDYALHHVKHGTWETDLFYKTVDIEYEE